jgi:hypothetical protein
MRERFAHENNISLAETNYFILKENKNQGIVSRTHQNIKKRPLLRMLSNHQTNLI